MSEFDAAASVSAGQVQSEIQMAVMSKIMNVVKQQGAATASLIEDAAELAEQTLSSEPGKGTQVDVRV